MGFADLAAFDHRCILQLRELERIQDKLEEFLSPQEARWTAGQIYDLVLDVDEELDRILADPLVRRFYEYDGRFFTPKQGWGFHRAFDAVHILKSLTDDFIETFFGAREQDPVRCLMDELGRDTWQAKVRRMNWEESKTLALIPQQVLDEIARHVRRQRGTEADAPLSAEEESFFRSFEEQMASRTQ